MNDCAVTIHADYPPRLKMGYYVEALHADGEDSCNRALAGGFAMKNNVYIETTTWNLDAPKVTFEWVEESGERFGRLVAQNEEKHTYTEINLDPETVRKLGTAMLASAASLPG